MCIKRERILSKPDKRVRWVWKLFTIWRKDGKRRLYPWLQATDVSKFHVDGFDKGKWLQASKSTREKVRGFHACGSLHSQTMFDLRCQGDIVRKVKVRNVIAENDQGDVRALEMFIPKQKRRKS